MAVTAQQALAHMRRRQVEQRAEAQRRAAGFRERLPEAAATLRERFGAKSVWLFGSLADGGNSAESDVDLAVMGLREGAYFDALTFLMEFFEAPVDLVEIERAAPSLRERIEAEGEPL